MILFILGLAPGVAIAWYVYNKDRWNKEPSRLIFWSFALGVLISFPAGIFELIVEPLLPFKTKSNLVSLFLYSLLGVALIEEGLKYYVIYKFLYPKEEFDEPFDGIVYSVMVGMGFATLENILYVISGGYLVGITRAFLAVPAHFVLALFMGYSFGLAKFGINPEKHLLQALYYPVFWHALYDFLIFTEKWYFSIFILVIVYGVGRWMWKRGQKLIIFTTEEKNDKSSSL